ncbi:MAG: hypothetical protein RL678_321 [Pseudomonadota bacterium]|jgi:hypothetical protein
MATTTIKIGKSGGNFFGTSGSDTFEIADAPKGNNVASISIDGLTSALNNSGNSAVPGASSGDIATALSYATDRKLAMAFRPGSTSSIDTNATLVSGYNAEDILLFRKSGDYSKLGAFFSNIETIQLASGVNIKLSADVFETIGEYADHGAVNTGILFQGIAGGKAEKVTFDIEYESEGIRTPTVGDSYVQADIQLDDYSFAHLFRNVDVVYDARDPLDDDDLETSTEGDSQISFGRYLRLDGANENGGAGESVLGTDGVDNATMRLGNDSYLAFGGNDLLIGHGGADSLDGGEGNDIFVIGGFGTGVSGTTSKADDGKAEWIIAADDALRTGVTSGATNTTDYANKFDVIKGSIGYDTLRVTTGIGATNAANGTIVLSDKNFVGMEKVEVGGTIAKDADESTYQQLRDGHYLFARASTVPDQSTASGGLAGNSINKVVIDASGVTKNGLTFDGNGNTQTFIGTSKSDTFIGNGGADSLTGGGGADKFVYQTIREYARDSGTANGAISYSAIDRALVSSDADTINDFVSGTDKIVFRIETTDVLEDSFDALITLTKGNLTETNVVIGDLADVDTAGGATSFIKANTTGSDVEVYYDADGSGAGTAVLIATLTGVSNVVASDFVLASVQNF